MLQLFRSGHPYVIFLIIFVAGFMWIPVFIQPDLFFNALDLSFSPILLFSGYQDQWMSVPLAMILGFVFWNLLAFQISQVNNRHLFMEARNYLPALFFLLSSCWMPGMQQINPALLGLIFIVMGVDRIIRSYEKSRTEYAYFDTGILMAIGSLLYLPYLIFLPLTWIAIIVSRSIRLRNFSNSFFGFLAPWWIMYGLVFFFKGSISDLNQMLIAFSRGHTLEGFIPYQFIVFAAVGLMIVLASVMAISSQPFKKVRFKRYFIIFFWIFSTQVVGYLLFLSNQNLMLAAISFPFSYLIANFFTHCRNEIHYRLLFLVYLIIMAGYPYAVMIMN